MVEESLAMAPNLRPTEVAAALSVLGSIGEADRLCLRLLDLPDTEAGAAIRLPTHPPDAGLLQSCFASYRLATEWFTIARPKALAAADDLVHFCSSAQTSCGAIRSLLTNETANSGANTEALTLVEDLRAKALIQSQLWAAATAAVAVFRGSSILPRLVDYDRQYNLWGVDPYETLKPQDAEILASTEIFQRLEGAWNMFGADAASIADTLKSQVEYASAFIAQLGLDVAEAEWRNLEAAARTLVPTTKINSGPVRTELGWMCIDRSDDGRFDSGFRLAADGTDRVCLRRSPGIEVMIERLSEHEFGYVRIQFVSTGRYLTASGDGSVVQADWNAADAQKWRAYGSGQQRLSDGVIIEGFLFLSRSSNAILTALLPVGGSLEASDEFSMTLSGDCHQLNGFSVFQITPGENVNFPVEVQFMSR